jgi:hypothetical protein
MNSSFLVVLHLLLLLMFDLTLAQPLDINQYNALMDVYNGLGVSSLHVLFGLSLFFFFFVEGCNTTICPRFSSSSNCTAPVTCVGGKVTRLCVCGRDWVYHGLFLTVAFLGKCRSNS